MSLFYYEVTSFMDSAKKAEFDRNLAPPDQLDAVIARQNKQAMQALAGFGLGPPPPARGKG